MAQTNGCGQFEVGTPRWTECVQDQATGGGLMPWIVVIPLAVMVVGMMIGFARQYSPAGRAKAKAHGAAGTAGSWLIFVSFIELAIGIGAWIGDRRAPGVGGGYSIAATVLLGVGILLFVIGVYLKVRGRRRARIYHSGVPGEAVIQAVHETGTMVNNQPMYAFDLEVTGQGFAPVTTTHREVVPFWFLNRVGPQSRVPVKVDPSNPARLIFDWDGLAARTPVQSGTAAASSFGGVAAPDVASGAGAPNVSGEAVPGSIMSAGSLAEAMQAAQDLADRRGSGWHAGKSIGLGIALFVLLVVGGALYFFSQVFGEVSAVTDQFSDEVADAVDDAERAFEEAGDGGSGGGKAGNAAGTTIEVSRAARGGEPVSFSLALPVAWNDVTAAVPERQGAVLVDVVMKPQAPSEARIVVTRSVRYMEDPAPRGAGIGSVRKGIEQEFGDSLVRSRPVRLGGEAAIALDIAPGADGLRSRQVAVMRGGQVLFVNLTAPEQQWDATLKVFGQVLDSWHWGTVSA